MLRTDFFESIMLEQMDQVQLMNRTDKKFWFNQERLQSILFDVSDQYLILKIDGQDQLPYETNYFDTYTNEMYTCHHNGKLNRYKIRKRTYVQSGISFLEIKHKTNKGRTIKKRIPTEEISRLSKSEELEFVETNSPYHTDNLQPALRNRFTRITLVNKNFKERCTIDFNICFEYKNQKMEMGNLVIVELKSDNEHGLSPLAVALRENRIKASGFSKYCLGRSIIDSEVKTNAFKNKLRQIEKSISLSEALI